MSSQKTIKFDLESTKKAIIRKFPLVADVFANVQFHEAPLKTAATDGKDIFYNPNFMDTLSYQEQIFVIAHEALHIAFDHINRRYNIIDENSQSEKFIRKQKELWNVATDAVINQALQAEGLPIKQGFVNIKEALNQQADIIYKKLLEDYQNQQENDSQQEQGNSNSDNDGSSNSEVSSCSGQGNNSEENSIEDWANQFGEIVDDHDFWDRENEAENDNEAQSSKPLQSEDKKDDKEPSKVTDEEQENNTTKQKGKDLENNFTSKNREKKQEITSKVMDEIKQQKDKVKEFGEHAGEKSSTYGEVGRGKSLYNWKRILNREFNDYIRQWSSRRATYENDYQSRIVSNYMYNKPRTEIILDTSGSIDDDLLKGFIRQLKPMLIDSQLFVGCFDTKFYGFTEIKSNKDIDNFKVVGRGGTDLDIAARSFSPDDKINKVIFTDGQGNMPRRDLEKIKRLFWVVFDNDDFYPCCGKVLYADADEIRREYLKLTQDNPTM